MNIAIVLSGGTGQRFGSNIPKQYTIVNKKMVITYCLETIIKSEKIDAVQIVADRMWQEEIINEMQKYKTPLYKLKGFSNPGKNRQMSILHGLLDVSSYANSKDLVMVHDAARPLLSEQLIENCFSAADGHDGVMPTLPMKDTVYLSEDGHSVTKLLERNKIIAGQAPEVFVLGKYLEVNKILLPDKILQINGSAEPAIMAGLDIRMIQGDEQNFKITTQADLKRFVELINKGVVQ